MRVRATAPVDLPVAEAARRLASPDAVVEAIPGLCDGQFTVTIGGATHVVNGSVAVYGGRDDDGWHRLRVGGRAAADGARVLATISARVVSDDAGDVGDLGDREVEEGAAEATRSGRARLEVEADLRLAGSLAVPGTDIDVAVTELTFRCATALSKDQAGDARPAGPATAAGAGGSGSTDGSDGRAEAAGAPAASVPMDVARPHRGTAPAAVLGAVALVVFLLVRRRWHRPA